MKTKYIHKTGSTYYLSKVGANSFTIIDNRGVSITQALSELSAFKEADLYQIDKFNRELEKYGYSIINGRLTNKDVGMFYCSDCNQPIPLDEEYHTNNKGMRICDKCYAKSLPTISLTRVNPNSLGTYYCFDCNRQFPLNSEVHLNELGCRICPECYKKSLNRGKQYLNRKNSEKIATPVNTNKLISLSA